MSHLSRKDLENVVGKLRARQMGLLEEVREEFDQRENQHLIELMSREPGDSGDYSMADEVADLNIAMADRQVRELRDIDAAFARIKDGNFGQCVDCGADIEPARLLAYPTAKRCLACQERHEQLFAQEARPKL